MARFPFIPGVLVACLLCVGCREGVAPEPGEFDFGSCRYPIVYVGEAIHGGDGLVVTGMFEPLFGADRACVNPTPPSTLRDGGLTFTEPGEYYLRLEGDRALKVLVLPRDEPISEAVIRIFDFCAANLLVMTGNNAEWYADADALVSGWCRSDQPKMLLCGPTYGLFKRLIDERLGLPIRLVTFPGTYRVGEKLQKGNHNVAEVYLPDVGKWVLFDVNNAFMVRWKSALELSVLVKAASRESELLTVDQWQALQLPVHLGAPVTYSPVAVVTDSEQFRTEFLSATTRREIWHKLSCLYIGGPAYFGSAGYGTGFLPAPYNFASFHDDPELERAAVEWVRTFDLEVAVFSGDEMARMLDEGHREQIAEARWLR